MNSFIENETKSDRFKRVAERRTKVVLRDLRIIGNCGNKGNYFYTEEQVRKIFSEIEQAVKEAKSRFHLPKEKEFKL
jgi:hypothetical protein